MSQNRKPISDLMDIDNMNVRTSIISMSKPEKESSRLSV